MKTPLLQLFIPCVIGRVWLPLLIMAFGDFIVAYSIVAWLCWVPNLLVANFIVRKLGPYQT